MLLGLYCRYAIGSTWVSSALDDLTRSVCDALCRQALNVLPCSWVLGRVIALSEGPCRVFGSCLCCDEP